MKENENIETKINEVLNSVDGIPRATPGPYFFTRLQQRLQRSGKKTSWEILSGWISRPVIALGSLIIIMLLNLAVLLNKPDRFGYEDNVDDYAVASSTIFDYETPDTE